MFGFLYALFGVGARGVAKVGGAIANENERIKEKGKGELTYTDINGKTRLISNNQIVVYTWDDENNKVVKDPITGKIYKNFGEEQKEKQIKNAVQFGETVITLRNIPCKYRWGANKLGTVYQDVKTNNLYIQATVNYITFYMDVQNGHLVRIADGFTDKRKKGNLSVEEIIMFFNQRQDRVKGTFKDEYKETENFYLYKSLGDWFVDDDKKVKQKTYSGMVIE